MNVSLKSVTWTANCVGLTAAVMPVITFST